ADKGAALRGMELWDEAAGAYRESLALAREFALPDHVAAAEGELFAIAASKVSHLYRAGDFTRAEQAAHEQLALADELRNVNVRADALRNLGQLAADQKQ